METIAKVVGQEMNTNSFPCCSWSISSMFFSSWQMGSQHTHCLAPTPTRAASSPTRRVGDREIFGACHSAFGGGNMELLQWEMEEQIVHICRKPYFSISAVQGISDIYLEGSEGNYGRVQPGLKGKGLKCVGNWDTLVLPLIAWHSNFQPLLFPFWKQSWTTAFVQSTNFWFMLFSSSVREGLCK